MFLGFFPRDLPIKNFHSGDFRASQPGSEGDMVHLEEQLVPVATKSLGKRLRRRLATDSQCVVTVVLPIDFHSIIFQDGYCTTNQLLYIAWKYKASQGGPTLAMSIMSMASCNQPGCTVPRPKVEKAQRHSSPSGAIFQDPNFDGFLHFFP